MSGSPMSSDHRRLAPATPRTPASSSNLENAPSRSAHIGRILNFSHSSSPSRPIYSDRFIPSRSGSNFALFDISNSPTSSEGKDDASGTYTTLLRAALFGPDTPDKKDFMPANRNIFRYKTETKRACHSLFPVGFDEAAPGLSHSSVKAPRKVPRSPYKVDGCWFYG